MNILIAVAYLSKNNGGVSTHIVELSKQLKKEGNNVIVVSAGGEYVSELDVKHYTIDFAQIQSNPRKLLKAYKEIKK